MKVTIRNNFHNTEVTLEAKNITLEKTTEYYLSPAQVDKAKRELCGLRGCTCSGVLGQRGPQNWSGEQIYHGFVIYGQDKEK